MLSRWPCAAAGPLPVVTGPGLGEFHAHHAVLGTALINQLPAPKGSRIHKTVTAPTCAPYCVPTPGLLSCAVPGLGATQRLDGASLPRHRRVFVCVCVCVCGGRGGGESDSMHAILLCLSAGRCMCVALVGKREEGLEARLNTALFL